MHLDEARIGQLEQYVISWAAGMLRAAPCHRLAWQTLPSGAPEPAAHSQAAPQLHKAPHRSAAARHASLYNMLCRLDAHTQKLSRLLLQPINLHQCANCPPAHATQSIASKADAGRESANWECQFWCMPGREASNTCPAKARQSRACIPCIGQTVST